MAGGKESTKECIEIGAATKAVVWASEVLFCRIVQRDLCARRALAASAAGPAREGGE